MVFNRPTLIQIIDRALADLQASLGTAPLLRNSFVGALVKAIGGAVHLLYGFLTYISKQALPDTAEGDYLNRWAAIWGVNRSAADYSQGNVTFTGTNSTDIPAGTLLQNAAGLQYTTDALGTISSGTATVAVTATFAGEASNASSGDTVSLLNPIAGVSSTVTVASGGLTGGVDQESDESLRDQMLQRIQNPPQGGSKNDYERWALEVSGVSRAFVFPEMSGAGTVGVAILGPDDAVPDAGVISDTQDYIDDDDRRPVTANVTVFAPTLVEIDFTISVAPNSAEVKAAIEDSLQAMLKRDAEPGATIYLSRIREAVSIAAGETDSTVTVPSADVTYDEDEMAIFGEITWV